MSWTLMDMIVWIIMNALLITEVTQCFKIFFFAEKLFLFKLKIAGNFAELI